MKRTFKYAMFQTFSNGVFGAGNLSREGNTWLIDGTPISDEDKFPIDKTNADFFTDDAFKKLILNKVVKK